MLFNGTYAVVYDEYNTVVMRRHMRKRGIMHGMCSKGELNNGSSGAEEIRTLYAMMEWLLPDLGRRSSRRAMIRSISSSRALARASTPVRRS